MSSPPVALHKSHAHTEHGLSRPDPYHWLKNKEDPDTIAYLEAENSHTESAMAHLQGLRKVLYSEMLERIVEDDTSAPYFSAGYFYYSRTVSGKAYPIYCRRKGSMDADEQVILDVNQLGEGQEYISLSGLAMSPSQRYIAWLQDDDGAERFRLRVRDLETGETLGEQVTDCKWSLAFASDNRTVFYTRADHAQRPFQIWRHDIHRPAAEDVLVLEDPDERFFMGVSKTRDDRYIVLGSQSKVTSELHLIDAHQPTTSPIPVWPRQQGIEAMVGHGSGTLYFRTNLEAQNFRVLSRPADALDAPLTEVIAHDPAVLLEGVSVFARHLVLREKHNGLPRFTVARLADGARHQVSFPDESYTLSGAENPEFDTDVFRFEYTSFAQPTATFSYDMASRERVLLKEKPVGGDFDKSRYIVERTWATASDGTRVPVSMVRLRSVAPGGEHPTYLIGYGSYGSSYPVYFSPSWLTLVDRGIIVAIAHIRGGQEMGRHWYEEGKGFNKKNTFTDFISCAEHLIAAGWTAADRLAIQGGSAGGLLMGAVANLRPDLFRAVIARVPFVDVINTMMDPNLPLTVVEYEEWGNPNERPVYDYMFSYSPYDNVEEKAYPAMLITAGLNDPRVGYWEPAKWIARLRAQRTNDAALFMRTNMGAGHGGQSGRYGRLEDTSYILSFTIEQLGADTTPRQ
jgi:oligopeptidase B